MSKKLLVFTIVLTAFAIAFSVSPQKAAAEKWQVQLSGNPWVDKIGTTIFAPFYIVLAPARIADAFCESKRSCPLKYWDATKSLINQDMSYAQNMFGAVLNVLTPWSPRNYTVDWAVDPSLSKWAQKSDLANIFKLVAAGTTFGFVAAEAPVFSMHLANDLWAMYGITTGAQYTYRGIEYSITGQ